MQANSLAASLSRKIVLTGTVTLPAPIATRFFNSLLAASALRGSVADPFKIRLCWAQISSLTERHEEKSARTAQDTGIRANLSWVSKL